MLSWGFDREAGSAAFGTNTSIAGIFNNTSVTGLFVVHNAGAGTAMGLGRHFRGPP
jgi:hypothetical protein